MKEKILIYYSNAIGDTFMTLPTIRAFSSTYKRVSIICAPVHVYLLQEIAFEEVFLLETSPGTLQESLPEEVFPELQKRSFDFFISLSSFHNEIIGRIIANNSFKTAIGYVGECYDYELADPYAQTNMFDVYFKSYSMLNRHAKIEEYSQPIVPNKTSMGTLAFAEEFKLVAVHTDTKPEKMWPESHFIELIRGIIQYAEEIVVLIIGMPKRDYSFISERVLQHNSTDFEVSWELLTVSDYFIGVDSCFMHIADINNIPSLALFGPSNELEWGFRFNGNATILKGEKNSMDTISVDDALKCFRRTFRNSNG